MRIGKKVIFGLVMASVAGLSYSALGAENGAMIPAEGIVWKPLPGGPLKVAELWGDRTQGAHGMLLKFPPGYEAGSHKHTADYHGLTVQGVWVHIVDGERRELPVGSYVMQPGGQFHNDICKGPDECVIFLHQDAKGDFIPAPK
jgi:anti-sigma factor ChrR (cupin superfamily)